MLQNDIAKSVNRFNKEFAIPTFRDLIKLTDKINVPAQYKPFIVIADVCSWAQTAAGVDPLLSLCAKIKLSEVEALGEEYQRYLLAQELILRFMGYGEIKTETEVLVSDSDSQETPVPLVEQSQSGA